MVRVENLDSFRNAPPAALRFASWRSTEGTWIMLVGISIIPKDKGPVENFTILNPRQEKEYDLILRFPRLITFPAVLVSADLSDDTKINIPWSVSDGAQLQKLIEEMNETLTEEKINGNYDSDFEQAKQELQTYCMTRFIFPEHYP